MNQYQIPEDAACGTGFHMQITLNCVSKRISLKIDFIKDLMQISNFLKSRLEFSLIESYLVLKTGSSGRLKLNILFIINDFKSA